MKSLSGDWLRMGLALMVLFMASLACGSFPLLTKAPTKEVRKTPTDTRVVAPTQPAEATPTQEPSATAAKPTVEKPAATATVEVVKPTESWRVQPIEGATLLAFDQTPNMDPEWVADMDKQARNLAIPKPYYFEMYSLPIGSSYVEIRDYYNDLLTQNGMKKGMDYVGDNGVAVASWVGTLVHNRKYLVQFIPGEGKTKPLMFIMYSNPQ